jgi:hypothetical protein
VAQTVERWEDERIEWMRRNGVRRWRDAAGRELELSDRVQPQAEPQLKGPLVAKERR